MLHLRALLRYKPAAIAQRPVILASGAVEMDVARRLVTLDGIPLILTKAEFRILAILMERRGHVQNRAVLAQNLWGDAARNLRALDAHVTRLRRKLGGYRRQLRTLRGLGYKWQAD
jgi:DNA-binding response OmpR family regulator